MTCHQLSKRLPGNSAIFAAEATAITLALDYNRHMDPAQHDVIFYSDSMSCLPTIEGEDTEPPHLSYHERPLGIAWQRHLCPLVAMLL